MSSLVSVADATPLVVVGSGDSMAKLEKFAYSVDDLNSDVSSLSLNPVSMMESLKKMGVESSTAGDMVKFYYQCVLSGVRFEQGAASDDASSASDAPTSSLSGVSAASGRSARRRARMEVFKQKRRDMAEEPGYCYLKAVRLTRRVALRDALGYEPSFQDFCQVIDDRDLDYSVVSQLQVHLVTYRMGSSLYHLNYDVNGSSGSFRDALLAVRTLSPRYCLGLEMDKLGSPVRYDLFLPLTGRVGSFQQVRLGDSSPVNMVSGDLTCWHVKTSVPSMSSAVANDVAEKWMENHMLVDTPVHAVRFDDVRQLGDGFAYQDKLCDHEHFTYAASYAVGDVEQYGWRHQMTHMQATPVGIGYDPFAKLPAVVRFGKQRDATVLQLLQESGAGYIMSAVNGGGVRFSLAMLFQGTDQPYGLCYLNMFHVLQVPYALEALGYNPRLSDVLAANFTRAEDWLSRPVRVVGPGQLHYGDVDVDVGYVVPWDQLFDVDRGYGDMHVAGIVNTVSDELAKPTFAVIIACASMLVTIICLLIRISCLRK